MEIDNQINFLRPAPISEPPLEPSRPKKKSWLFFIIILVFVFFGGYAYRAYSLNHWPTEASIYDPVTLKPKKVGFLTTVKNFVFHSDNILEGQVDDRVNILLLGMGGPGHDGPYLTDTNIVLSIKPSTKQISMTSVPRDMGVVVDGHGLRKINYANSYGEANNPGEGGEFARKIFEKTFDLKIPYYVRVDFTAFEEMIDEVGGVTVNVTRPFTDTQFPGPNNSYQTVSFTAGEQTLNGTKALQYARSRHGNNGEGSDFARSRRQQQILTALKNRLLSFGTYTNPIKVQNILKTLSNHITTNLDFGQMMYLANLGRETNGEIKMLVLDNGVNGFLVSSNNPGSGYILSPKTGNFNDVNNAIKNIFETELAQPATIVLENNVSIFPTAKIEVQNGTWLPGLAARMQRKLQDDGFTVLTASNSAKRPWEKTQIHLLKKSIAPEIKAALLKEWPEAVVTDGLPDWLPLSSSIQTTSPTDNGIGYNKDTDILIILGTDTKE